MTIGRFSSRDLDAHARGVDFGKTWRSRLASVFRGYGALFSAAGAEAPLIESWALQALHAVEDWAPSLARELRSIAEGAGMPAWQIAALNARTEILAAAAVITGRPLLGSECSTVVYIPPGGGAPLTIQTWDWHEHLRDGRIVWTYETEAGVVVHTFTECGVLAKIGVNSRRVGVHFNLLRHPSDTDAIGVPVHLVARRILDEAGCVADAREIAGSATLSASTAITVVAFGDGDAEALCLELSPAGIGEVRPNADGFLLHTNHFIAPELRPDARWEVLDEQLVDSRARHDLLEGRCARLQSPDATDRARAMVSHLPGAAICAHPNAADPLGARGETLVTACLDLDALELQFHEGGPCRVEHETWQAAGGGRGAQVERTDARALT